MADADGTAVAPPDDTGASSEAERDSAPAENSDVTAAVKATTARGRPFQPGQTGNPGGRPRGLAVLRESIQARGAHLVDELFAIVDELPRQVPQDEGPAFYVGPTHRDRIMAIDKLLAYGYDKPIQAVEVSGPGGGPLATADVTRMTTEQRRARLEELTKAAQARTAAAETSPGGGGGDSQ